LEEDLEGQGRVRELGIGLSVRLCSLFVPAQVGTDA
jgi:hypothetical protein